jgi:hypothetical protein
MTSYDPRDYDSEEYEQFERDEMDIYDPVD